MKPLLILCFIVLAAPILSQTVPNQVVFKVRKKPNTIRTTNVIRGTSEIRSVPLPEIEVPATFQGGDVSKFKVWVAQNSKYPPYALENNIQGKVYVKFAVNSKGKVDEVKVMKGVDPSLDAEAVRVVSASPEWTPPRRRGEQNVKQYFTIPVIFNLEE